MQSLNYFKENEPQLFKFWQSLTEEQQLTLESQIKAIDVPTLLRQKELLTYTQISFDRTFEPFKSYAFSGKQENRALGEKLLSDGKVCCLVLAGGQGTRLQHSGPKGTYPISPLKQKSLFQLCAEKVRAASAWVKRPLQLAIMISPDNDDETQAFFHQHCFFGLSPDQVSFFVQSSLPLLDRQGHLFLKTPWQITTGADGNGNCLLNFASSTLLQKWIDRGIEEMAIIPIDNPLAEPFDLELIGFHHQQKNEMTLKCTEKKEPEEKVGVLVEEGGHSAVIEYSELPDAEKHARDTHGRLKHCCANLSLFCLSLSFIKKIVQEGYHLPLHKAWKAAPYVDDQGHSHVSQQPTAWKFETFIFDWLRYANRVSALIYPREECFAPLKNASGQDSPDTVRQAIKAREDALLQSLTGFPPPQFPFELPAEFYYPTPEFKAYWKGRQATPTDFEK